MNLKFKGIPEEIINTMIIKGLASNKTEAIRLTVLDYENNHQLLEEDFAFEIMAKHFVKQMKEGKVKTQKFDLSELD